MGQIIARTLWNLFDDLYYLTGLRWQAPIEYFIPDFAPKLFDMMIGIEGNKVR